MFSFVVCRGNLTDYFILRTNMTDFTIRKHIRCKDDGVNDYIEALENFIINLKAENTNRLIFKLDELNGVIADDVQMIINGETTEEAQIPALDTADGFITVNVSKLRVLNDSKDSKIFDRVLSLYGKLKDLKETSNVVKSMIPVIEEKEDEQEILIDKTTNIFEQIQEKHYNRKKTK